MSDNGHRTWWRHHHVRLMEGCQWCDMERRDSQPPIDDMPLVYGPKERTWFDDEGRLHHARPERLARLLLT